MKTVALIWTMSTLLWAQFGKYAAYIACTLSQTEAEPCPCEQLSAPVPNEDNTSPVPPLRAFAGIEDFYLDLEGWRLPPAPPVPRPGTQEVYGLRCATGVASAIFRPPRG